MIDSRLTDCGSVPEIEEDFNRVLAIVDETGEDATKAKTVTDAIACTETEAGTYTLTATVDAEGAVTYAWTIVPEEVPEGPPAEE